MALTASNPFELGTLAPDFQLRNTVNNRQVSLAELKGPKGTAIFFICNHCPFVIHINPELVKVANAYQEKGIGFIAISSNDVATYPQDGPILMRQVAIELQYPFPYLYDESQDVAKAYKAACTPDLYLFDADLKAVYHGQFDSSRPGSGIPITGEDFRSAMDYLLAGESNPNPQRPCIGCNIKWK